MDDRIPYRVEYATTNRAGCKGSAACKKDNVKILKTELRFGTWVENDFMQGWAWRHWGCVTPKVLSNVSQKLDGEYDLLDGLEDLSEDDQEKVKKAISQGEIDEADVTPGIAEEIEAKEAEKKAKVAEKEAKQLQKQREKEEKKAQKEREKDEKKAQKEREKADAKAKKEADKASKAKKRKRDVSESDASEQETVPAKKRNIKQEDDATPVANSKVKREVASKGSKKRAKEELPDSQPKKVKNEDGADPKPKRVKQEGTTLSEPKKAKQSKSAAAANLDGAADEAPATGRGKAKANGKASTVPVRRSARNKR